MKRVVLMMGVALMATSCQKWHDTLKQVKRGQIVKVHQDMGKGVVGPFRVDSLAKGPGDLEDSNWYWITSNNGVDVQEEGYYMENCDQCSFTWAGPSKFLPNPWTNGDTVMPRTKGN